MARVALLLSLVICCVFADLPDLGYPGWTCHSSVFQKSKNVPRSAHAVRFPDFNVIGALGDSLTAASGAGAPKGNVLGVGIEYRGLAFQIGGDKSLDEHVTVANVMRKFNPNIFGYSTGTGSANNWEKSKLNQAIGGAQSGNVPKQARALVQLIRDHPTINIRDDWKLINIFIGANDMCAYCQDKNHTSGTHAKTQFKKNLIESVQILKDNLPRTVVSMTGMVDMSMVRKIDKGQKECDALHLFECPCERTSEFDDDSVSADCHLYMDAQQEIIDSGMFDTSDDFTLVLQPFLNDIKLPPMNPDGGVNLDFFAPDCFHFSQLGHANVAKHLWNNIVQPVGMKDLQVNLSDPTIPLRCPDTACPFFRTTKNSVDCSKYL